MKHGFLTLAALFALSAAALAQPEQPFTPGNLVLVDAAEDRLIEVELGETEASVVQVVTWPLEDTSRRRPLGMAFDPNGTAYVGITGVPTSATEAVEFPEGRGEILRILPDGSIDFTTMPEEITKGTWVSSFNANEVFLMSNEPPPSEDAAHSFRFRFSGDEVVDITTFNVTTTLQGNGNYGSGKALALPDGRILIPSTEDPRINIYTDEGGDAVDSIATEKNYRSLAYLEGSDEMLAIPGTGTVDRISMDGEVLGTFDFSLDGLGGVWNFTLFEDGSERFIATNHNGPAATKSIVFIYDSKILEELPIPVELPITGLEAYGDSDGLATQLFDHAFVPEPTRVGEWSVY